MKKVIYYLGLTIIFFVLIRCTNGKEEEPDSQDKPVDTEKSMQEAIDNMKDLMSGDSKVETVDFRVLKDLLPETIGNLQRQNASGEKTAAFGIKVAKAEADYMSPDSESNVSVELTDLGSLKGLTAMTGFAWAFSEYDRETDDGYERTTTYRGFKAVEEYNSSSNSGKIMLLVADRFSVNVQGYNITMDDLKNVLNNIDLDKLIELKDFGVEN